MGTKARLNRPLGRHVTYLISRKNNSLLKLRTVCQSYWLSLEFYSPDPHHVHIEPFSLSQGKETQDVGHSGYCSTSCFPCAPPLLPSGCLSPWGPF